MHAYTHNNPHIVAMATTMSYARFSRNLHNIASANVDIYVYKCCAFMYTFRLSCRFTHAKLLCCRLGKAHFSDLSLSLSLSLFESQQSATSHMPCLPSDQVYIVSGMYKTVEKLRVWRIL